MEICGLSIYDKFLQNKGADIHELEDDHMKKSDKSVEVFNIMTSDSPDVVFKSNNGAESVVVTTIPYMKASSIGHLNQSQYEETADFLVSFSISS